MLHAGAPPPARARACVQVALRGGEAGLCGFRRKADGAAVAAASRLLRFTRLFCFTEGAGMRMCMCMYAHSMQTATHLRLTPRDRAR